MADASEIIVKIVADATGFGAQMDAAAAQVKASQDAMNQAAADTAAAVTGASAKTAGAVQGVGGAASEAAGAVSDAAAAIAESTQAAADAAVASTAQMDAAFDAIAVNINAAADAAKAGIAEMAASMLAPMALLNGIADGTATSMDALAAQEAQLDDALAAGTISAEEYAVAMAQLDAQTDALGMAMDAAAAQNAALVDAQNAAMSAATGQGAAEDAVTAEVDANTVATDANTESLAANNAERSRMPMGVYGAGMRVMEAAASPIGALIVGTLALGAAAVRGAIDQQNLNDAVLVTGQVAGASSDDLMAMADTIANQSVSVGRATDALKALALSGKIASDSMQTAGQAVADMAALTGEKTAQAATAVEALGKDPVQAVAKLNDQFHFLTVAQFNEIESLAKVGNQSAATKLAIDDFSMAMHADMQQSIQDAGYLVRAWDTVKGSAVALFHEAESFGQTEGPAQQAQGLRTRLEADQKGGFVRQVGNNFFMTQKGAESSNAESLQILINGYQKLEPAVEAATAAEAAHSAALQKTAQTIDAEAKADKVTHRGHNSDGDREAARLEKQANDEQLRGLQEIRSATQANSQARITADANVLNFATRAYGQQSSQFAAALRQMEQDAKSEAAQEKQIALGSAENAKEVAEASIARKRQDAQTAEAEGKITAAQLLQIELQLDQERLAADINYFKEKSKLDAGNVIAVQRDAAQVQIAQQKMHQQMEADTERMLKNQEQQWREHTQRIQGMVTSQVNAIIFQHQTMRAALENIGESIAEDEISAMVKSLFEHQAVEAAKTVATITGNAERVAADETGQAQSLAIQGAAAIKWILTEAAKAAAGAFNALVSIPYVGPFLAIGASIAAFAAVSKLVGSVASAEGGWERVPADGMQTVLHRDEMVLPKSVADPIRNMARGGSGGAVHNHYNVQAWDSRDLGQFILRHGGTLNAAMNGLRRNGWR